MQLPMRYKAVFSATITGVTIGLITLIWTDGTTVIPVDFRIYNIDEDDKTKNDHFRDMIDKGEERGFNPEFVLFDTWYASVKNLRACLKIQPDLTIGIGLHI